MKKARKGDRPSIFTACRILKSGFYRQIVFKDGQPSELCEKGNLCSDLLGNYIKRYLTSDGKISIEQTVKTEKEWKQYFINVSANTIDLFDGRTFDKTNGWFEDLEDSFYTNLK